MTIFKNYHRFVKNSSTVKPGIHIKEYGKKVKDIMFIYRTKPSSISNYIHYEYLII